MSKLNITLLTLVFSTSNLVYASSNDIVARTMADRNASRSDLSMSERPATFYDAELKKIFKEKDRLAAAARFVEMNAHNLEDTISGLIMANVRERKSASCMRNLGNRLGKLSKKDKFSDHGKIVAMLLDVSDRLKIKLDPHVINNASSYLTSPNKCEGDHWYSNKNVYTGDGRVKARNLFNPKEQPDIEFLRNRINDIATQIVAKVRGPQANKPALSHSQHQSVPSMPPVQASPRQSMSQGTSAQPNVVPPVNPRHSGAHSEVPAHGMDHHSAPIPEPLFQHHSANEPVANRGSRQLSRVVPDVNPGQRMSAQLPEPLFQHHSVEQPRARVDSGRHSMVVPPAQPSPRSSMELRANQVPDTSMIPPAPPLPPASVKINPDAAGFIPPPAPPLPVFPSRTVESPKVITPAKKPVESQRQASDLHDSVTSALQKRRQQMNEDDFDQDATPSPRASWEAPSPIFDQQEPVVAPQSSRNMVSPPATNVSSQQKVVPMDRSGLMAQIQSGAQLRKTPPQERRGKEPQGMYGQMIERMNQIPDRDSRQLDRQSTNANDWEE